ncbi:PspC domain-containing protein [Microbacterium fluvii]|uniref:PspC domain-containing protein n=1 Tax=Microbacterium fluvii TaxID=415215 RepID=A0ABW2HB31_9MICO|nr:ATP-binding protein [Microbacterium fluvii]MCU4671285.1 PspC domain-containing protein [Microbacterium fluvii]
MSSGPLVSAVRPARPPRPPRPPRIAAAPRPALVRPRECAVSGVSAGLARHLGAPVWAIRALFVALVPALGAGVLLYAWCWALMPWEAGSQTPARRAPVAWMLVGTAAVLTIVAMPMLSALSSQGWVEGYVPFGELSLTAVTVVLVAAIVALSVTAASWATFIDRGDPNRGPRQSAAVRWSAAGVLAVLLTVCWLAQGLRVVGVGVLVLGLLPLAGILLIVLAPLAGAWRDLSGERIKRIREEQRAEMAAHLHDSVLQTLALIQNRSGASSEVSRLARAQERELRAWLYDGDAPADSDLPTDLRDYAGALELDYPVRIDVVSAGLSTERASGEVAAAAREAMLNAARHAGGEVSVYIEGSERGVDVYVRDRGAGFDVDAVADDRLGVRQSIVGRMRRVGGSATVKSGEGGTEVHLSFTAGDARG